MKAEPKMIYEARIVGSAERLRLTSARPLREGDGVFAFSDGRRYRVVYACEDGYQSLIVLKPLARRGRPRKASSSAERTTRPALRLVSTKHDAVDAAASPGT